jgi:hypothetical protein
VFEAYLQSRLRSETEAALEDQDEEVVEEDGVRIRTMIIVDKGGRADSAGDVMAHPLLILGV